MENFGKSGDTGKIGGNRQKIWGQQAKKLGAKEKSGGQALVG